MNQLQAENKEYPISSLFLKEFFYRLITLGYSEEIAKARVIAGMQKLQEWKNKEKTRQMESQKDNIKEIKIEKPLIIPVPTQQSPNYSASVFRPLPKAPPRQMTPQKIMAPQKTSKQEYSISIASQNQSSIMKKILPILNDPQVSSIECIGPSKPILINRYGSIQTSQVSLNANEITSLLQEISTKTRIPVLTGTFKAMFDSFIITAIISDFIGTRFIIQKKPNPPMPPQRFR